jgi:molybdopterin biosynthesis enzyme
LRQFLTVRLKNWDAGRGTRDGEIVAESAYKESGTITSLSDADGFIVIPEEVTYLEAGAGVIVTLF